MNEPVRKLVAAIVCDLAAHLNNLSEPIVIGGQYGGANSKLVQAVAAWTIKRHISLAGPDAEGWLIATETGMFNGSGADVTD